MTKRIKAIPLELNQANDFVDSLHRHHQSVHRDKFRVGAEVDGKLVGVAQVGRPVSRMLDDGQTLEVVRLCTDGTKDVCSFLYSRCARVAKELGYKKIITYILETENGASLHATGWKEVAVTGGGSWDRPSRKRNTSAPTCPKRRFEKILRGEE
jgi:hypothetical protein